LTTTLSWSQDLASMTIKMASVQFRFTAYDFVLLSSAEVEVYRSEPRILDEVEQQIPHTLPPFLLID
jgi:hypothetical protein